MKFSPLHLVLLFVIMIILMGNILLIYLLYTQGTPSGEVSYSVIYNLCGLISVAIMLISSVYYWRLSGVDISVHQFFFLLSVLVASLLLNLRFYIYKFQFVISENNVMILVRIFSFLYILMIFLMVIALTLVNIKYSDKIFAFVIILLLSAVVSQAGIFAYSQAVGVYYVFMGGGHLLPIIGFLLVFIAMGIYCVDMVLIKVRVLWVIKQTVTLIGFLLSLHVMVLFPQILLLEVIASMILIVCLILYLRGIFIQLF